MEKEKIKSIRQVKKLAGKTVLLRVDFNVPIRNGRILDDYKIVNSLETIRFLLRYKCRVIIVSHLGRPTKRNKKDSLAPVAKKLGELLGKSIGFANDCIGVEAWLGVDSLKGGEVIMLENLRFYKDEEANSKKFAKALARFADIYVNNAFAVSHRAHASVSAIKSYLPSYAGILLENEIRSLNKILSPRKPMVVVLGGAKIKTKLPLIKKIRKKADNILIGGALANNFLYLLGYEVGKSMIDKKDLKLAKGLIAQYKKATNKKIILPIDVLVSNNKAGKGRAIAKSIREVGKRDYIYDIGPQTIKLYTKFIKKSKTIIWNGPLGFAEIKSFQNGTLEIAKEIATHSYKSAFGVVGGGETIEALRKTDMIDYVDWVSTGGGAMLSFLSGERLPGLQGIVK